MNILLIHLGTPCECFIASSVIKGLKNKYKKCHPLHIYVLVDNKDCLSIFKYNHHIRLVYVIDQVPSEFRRKKFDLFINLHPKFVEDNYFEIDSKEKIGFHHTKEGDRTELYMYEGKKTSKNIFQMYYILSGLKWKGEGYSIIYNPRKKNKKRITGVYIINENLFDFVKKRLQLDLSVVKHIQHHKNIFKKLDELNGCENIITDDAFTMHQALFLRKNICFLETINYNYPIELFNNGKIFKIPKNIIQ